jgi:hypothetical protein
MRKIARSEAMRKIARSVIGDVERTTDMEPEFLAAWEKVKAHTMTGVRCGYGMWQAVAHVCDRGVPGDLVECGVWRGGSSMLAALCLMARGEHRRLWLYDTYAGMTEPTAEDIEALTGRPAMATWLGSRVGDRSNWCYSPVEDVREAMAGTGYPLEMVEFVKGPVERTLLERAPDGIALLRLDTDFHASTKAEMETLYPNLAPGGVLILDDYGYWQGARQAVDEYFDREGGRPLLSRLDWTGRMAVKA